MANAVCVVVYEPVNPFRWCRGQSICPFVTVVITGKNHLNTLEKQESATYCLSVPLFVHFSFSLTKFSIKDFTETT